MSIEPITRLTLGPKTVFFGCKTLRTCQCSHSYPSSSFRFFAQKTPALHPEGGV